jgi:hypothetical protein
MVIDVNKGHAVRLAIVIVGFGSSITTPRIIVSEIVRALAQSEPVTRIEVDLSVNPSVGLGRAPSLAAAHVVCDNSIVFRQRAPRNTRARRNAFESWIAPGVRTAIAYAWPGLDSRWIDQFLEIAQGAGAKTIVICESLPKSIEAMVGGLVDTIARADLVLAVDSSGAEELAMAVGAFGPVVDARRALFLLAGRSGRLPHRQITVFLSTQSGSTLSTLVAAFDAVPDALFNDYNLQLVLRYTGEALPNIVANRRYSNHVEPLGQDMSIADLQELEPFGCLV